jgi:hypothetical protein
VITDAAARARAAGGLPQAVGEVGPKLGAMICLNALDGHRQAAHFLDEVGRRLGGAVSIDIKHAVSSGLIDQLSGDVNLAPTARAGAIALLGHTWGTRCRFRILDGGRGGIDVVVPLQEEADPEGPVLTLPAHLQGQSDDVGRRPEEVVPALEDRHQGPPSRVGDTDHTKCKRNSGKSRRIDKSGSRFALLLVVPEHTQPNPCLSILLSHFGRLTHSFRTSSFRNLQKHPNCPGITLRATG